MTDAERETLIAAAGQELAEALPQAWAIDAYGSFARGEAWPNSDLDLAVLMPPGERLPDRVELLARLGCDVDLADLRQGGLDLAMEVLNDGRALLVRRRDETLEWEGRQLTDYEDFQPRRAGIIDAFLHDPLRTPDERGRNEDRRRCSQRGAGFKDDSTRQDAAILNVMRACESAVELANILTRAQARSAQGHEGPLCTLVRRGPDYR